MTSCRRCGNPIDFRFVNGKPIPFHLNGSCSSTASSWSRHASFAALLGIAEPPVLHRVTPSSDDVCYPIQCPTCQKEVFFLRHDGAGVWLNPPPNWPWYKHECMHHEADPREFAAAFAVSPSLLMRTDSLRWGLGVVGNVAVFLTRTFSVLQIHFASGDLRLVGSEGLRDDLIGQVVYLYAHVGRVHLRTTDGSKSYVLDENGTDPY